VEGLKFPFLTETMPPDSIRLQKYLDRARQCEKLASTVITDDARTSFLNAAHRWRDLAEKMEKVVEASNNGPT
jgi:hypothetical protein